MRGRRSREPSKGVAVLELALSMVFLVPLVCAVVDFGYYFYVGTNAEEAARQGAAQAVRKSGGAVCGSAQATTASNIVQNSYPTVVAPNGPDCLKGAPAGPADTVSALYCSMNEPPLAMGGVGGPAVVNTPACDNTPVANSWHITAQISFPLLLGFYKPLFPAGSISGTVRYTATATASP